MNNKMKLTLRVAYGALVVSVFTLMGLSFGVALGTGEGLCAVAGATVGGLCLLFISAWREK